MSADTQNNKIEPSRNSRTEKATPERKNVRTVVFSVSLRAGIGKAHEGLLREMVIL